MSGDIHTLGMNAISERKKCRAGLVFNSSFVVFVYIDC